MERSSAIEQLTTVTRRIAANIRHRPGGETTLEDTAPIKQVCVFDCSLHVMICREEGRFSGNAWIADVL